jgi:hypothetical protein
MYDRLRSSKLRTKKIPGLNHPGQEPKTIEKKDCYMPFDTNLITVLDLSKSSLGEGSDLFYALSQYQYHLRNLTASLKEMNHHLDKCNEWVYFIETCSKNLSE